MKRILLLIAAICFITPLFAATPFEPRETWPYLYENFMPGAVRTSSGALIAEGKYNVCIADGSLHYIAEDKVMKADMASIFTAMVGEDVYVKVRGAMYKVLAENDYGSIIEGVEVDWDEMNKVEVGYGVSVSSSSKHGLNVFALESGGNVNILNERIQVVQDNKMRGKVVPLKVTTYIYCHNRLTRASKSDVLDLPGIDKKDAGDFIKKEKIKWRKTDSLLKVLEYIGTHTAE
ncbi:MAG: hypothetical protein J5640_04885 [Bacteroidales bacterium]|nr:hypothetical protein [Bacteroidales bacterium]